MQNVVIDSPAGLEHLNRNIVSEVDDLFIILDPSDKSLTHIKKVKVILKEVGMMYDHFYLVGNYMFDEDSENYFKDAGEIFLGKIDYDKNVEEYNLKGRTLAETPRRFTCVSLGQKDPRESGVDLKWERSM